MERELIVRFDMDSPYISSVHVSNGDPNLDNTIKVHFTGDYEKNRDYIAKQLGYEILSWLELMRDEYEDYEED